jgi:hypothetical protein
MTTDKTARAWVFSLLANIKPVKRNVGTLAPGMKPGARRFNLGNPLGFAQYAFTTM